MASLAADMRRKGRPVDQFNCAERLIALRDLLIGIRKTA